MIQFPSFNLLREVSRVLMIRASAELALGQSERALADLDLLFYMANATRDCLLVGQLVGFTDDERGAQIIWEGLANHQWSDEQLRALQTKLQSMDRLASLQRAMKAERAIFGNGVFDYLKKQPSNTVLSMLQSFSETPWVAKQPSLLTVVISYTIPPGWLDFEQLNYNRCFEELFLPVFDMTTRRVYPQRAMRNQQTLEEGGISCIWQHKVIVRLLLSDITAVSMRSAYAQTTVDEAMLACALERCQLADGKFPDSLDALVPRFITKLPHDVITGEPLKYRRDGEGYVLYSVGWNEKDDGGKADKIRGSEDGDWVWQCPAKQP